MKSFIIKIVLFALAFFLVDKCFILIRNKAPEFDSDRRLEMVLEGRINKDIIVLGSSRGQSDINVQFLQDSLKTKDVFNLSFGGSTPEFQEFIFDKLIEHNKKPKLIIKLLDDDFELMNIGLDGNTKGFRIDRLYPLVKYEEIRTELIHQGEKGEILSKLFILHQLNRSNFNFRKKGVIDTIYGAKSGTKHDLSLNWQYSDPPLYNISKEEKLQIKHLVSLQKKCLKNDIKLIFTTAPVFREASKNWIRRMKQLTLPTTMFYEHDLNEKGFKVKENFSDFSHLNNRGSEIYTQGIVSFIKKNQLAFEK